MSKPKSIRPIDDNYPTPAEITRTLLATEGFVGPIWEPCAGAGEMALTLIEGGHRVIATTLREDHSSSLVAGGINFLDPHLIPLAANIVTNPPYSIAEEIIDRALELKASKAAFLLRAQWLGSERRYNRFFHERPPAKIIYLINRVAMYPGGYEGPRGAPKNDFAWFIWRKPFKGPTRIEWASTKPYREGANGQKGEKKAA